MKTTAARTRVLALLVVLPGAVPAAWASLGPPAMPAHVAGIGNGGISVQGGWLLGSSADRDTAGNNELGLPYPVNAGGAVQTTLALGTLPSREGGEAEALDEKLGKAGRSTRYGMGYEARMEAREQPERPDRPERPERPEQARPERPDRPDRGERR